MSHTNDPMVTITPYEKEELLRCSVALKSRDALKSVVCHMTAHAASVPLSHFDVAKEIYRNWLVFDEPKPKASQS